MTIFLNLNVSWHIINVLNQPFVIILLKALSIGTRIKGQNFFIALFGNPSRPGEEFKFAEISDF